MAWTIGGALGYQILQDYCSRLALINRVVLKEASEEIPGLRLTNGPKPHGPTKEQVMEILLSTVDHSADC